jgi:hypothetical protein
MKDKVIFESGKKQKNKQNQELKEYKKAEEAVLQEEIIPKELEAETQKLGEIGAEKDKVKESIKNQEKFRTIVEESDYILYKAKTFFPLDLFPDTIRIYLNKVGVKVSQFFQTSSFENIPIEDIKEIVVESGPLFSTLRINEFRVKPFRYKEACRLKSIVQGLIEAKKQGISLLGLKEEENLVEKLIKIGSTGE